MFPVRCLPLWIIQRHEKNLVLVEETRLKPMKQLGNHERELTTKARFIWPRRYVRRHVPGRISRIWSGGGGGRGMNKAWGRIAKV